MKKNLIYYIYPLKLDMVLFNLILLSKYYQMFDGERHVVVSLDDKTLSFEKTSSLINKYLPGITIHKRENDSKLGETAHFIFLLSKVKHTEGITFYAHAKGVWRQLPDNKPLKKWIELLYSINLGFNAIDERLKKYSVIGSFRKNRARYNISAPWHYSGTFFWFNNKRLFSRQWEKIEQSKWGVESYPGHQFPHSESYCIAHDNCPNLYKKENWVKIGVKP